MTTSERRKLSEDELFFYEDRVCGEADLVYRFCFALALNQESAQKLLLLTYKNIAGNLRALLQASTSQLRAALLKGAYAVFRDGDKKSAVGSSPLVGLLGSMPVDTRALLFGVDVAGLSVGDLAAITGGEELSLRKKLAMARKALVLDKHFS